MKKLIYNIFTKNNGIIMSMETLDYLSNKVTDENSINMILNAYKTQYNGNILHLNQIDKLFNLNQQQHIFFHIYPFKYAKRNFMNELETFRKFLSNDIILINALEENKLSKIFGIFYYDQYENLMLEDEYCKIQINFDMCENNGFLYENFFVSLEGTLKNNIFFVKLIQLPKWPLSPSINNFLDPKNIKICFINECDNMNNFINTIQQTHSPDLFVVSCSDEINLPEFSNKVIMCKKSAIYNILPSFFDNEKSINHNEIRTTNPVIIETFDKSIVFIDIDLQPFKAKGLFINDLPHESFLESYLSQLSANPFSKCNFSLQKIPDYIIIANNSKPYIYKSFNTTIINLPELKTSSCYAIIETKFNTSKIFFD